MDDSLEEILKDFGDTPTSDTCQKCEMGVYSIKIDDYTYKCDVCGDLYVF